jgi:hypothetical protein
MEVIDELKAPELVCMSVEKNLLTLAGIPTPKASSPYPSCEELKKR